MGKLEKPLKKNGIWEDTGVTWGKCWETRRDMVYCVITLTRGNHG